MQSKNIVGVIPAAGKATRLSPLPCSKELFPIGFTESQQKYYPKPIAQYLLEQMVRAGIQTCYIVLGKGKWDIPGYFGRGEKVGINLAYTVIDNSPGTPFSLDTIHALTSDQHVALGFPDMLFSHPDIYKRLIADYQKANCDVMLGLFPADQPQHVDMVNFNESGEVVHIEIKPRTTDLTWMWGVAVWSPVFTKFMHNWLHQKQTMEKELFVGDVIQAAIKNGLEVKSTCVADEPFIDVGIPENLRNAIHNHTYPSDTI